MMPDDFNQLGWNIVPKHLPDISNGDFIVLAIYREKTHQKIHRYTICAASDVIDFQDSFIAWVQAPALPKEAE